MEAASRRQQAGNSQTQTTGSTTSQSIHRTAPPLYPGRVLCPSNLYYAPHTDPARPHLPFILLWEERRSQTLATSVQQQQQRHTRGEISCPCDCPTMQWISAKAAFSLSSKCAATHVTRCQTRSSLREVQLPPPRVPWLGVVRRLTLKLLLHRSFLLRADVTVVFYYHPRE